MFDLITGKSKHLPSHATLPIVLDSTEVPVLEAGLEMLGGRAVVNSVNLEDGDGPESRMARAVAEHYGLVAVELEAAACDPAAVALLTEEQAKRLLAVPVRFEAAGKEEGARVVVLAVANPADYSAKEALAMATIGGARALGLDGRLGSLEVGKLADLIGVRTDHARQVPIYDPVSHLVYTAHGDDVVWSVVNGQVLMRDGVVRNLDEARVLDEARAAARQVRQAVQ